MSCRTGAKQNASHIVVHYLPACTPDPCSSSSHLLVQLSCRLCSGLAQHDDPASLVRPPNYWLQVLANASVCSLVLHPSMGGGLSGLPHFSSASFTLSPWPRCATLAQKVQFKHLVAQHTQIARFLQENGRHVLLRAGLTALTQILLFMGA